MGFSGLATYTDSDTAADLAFVAIRAMCKELRKGLKDKGNDWNTCGIDNVALFLRRSFCLSKSIQPMTK